MNRQGQKRRRRPRHRNRGRRTCKRRGRNRGRRFVVKNFAGDGGHCDLRNREYEIAQINSRCYVRSMGVFEGCEEDSMQMH